MAGRAQGPSPPTHGCRPPDSPPRRAPTISAPSPAPLSRRSPASLRAGAQPSPTLKRGTQRENSQNEPQTSSPTLPSRPSCHSRLFPGGAEGPGPAGGLRTGPSSGQGSPGPGAGGDASTCSSPRLYFCSWKALPSSKAFVFQLCSFSPCSPCSPLLRRNHFVFFLSSSSSLLFSSSSSSSLLLLLLLFSALSCSLC